MLREKFESDIRVGDILENAVQSRLEANGWHVTHVPGKFHYWDFAINKAGMVSKVEVKHDVASDRTGNYCIEKRWLNHTIASILIIGTPKEAWMIPVDEVKKLAQNYPLRQTGDQAINYSHLIPKHEFIPLAKRFL